MKGALTSVVDDGLRAELLKDMGWYKALGFTEWEWEFDPATAREDACELARALGCDIGDVDGGGAVLRKRWAVGDVEANDRRLSEGMARDEDVRAFCRECAVDRAYLDLVERGKGVDGLPEWTWNTLVDRDFRSLRLGELDDVNVAGCDSVYWRKLFYVYRDVEAVVSGFGREPWFDENFAYLHTL